MHSIWKDIPGYEGLYQVSNFGEVRSLRDNLGRKRTLVMKPFKNRGYCRVALQNKDKKKYYRVHRLVWEVFNGPIPKGMEVNHINEDTTDNRLANLNLLTHTENINWGTRNERAGLAHTKKSARMIGQYTLSGQLIFVWFGARWVVDEGYDRSCIHACCRGERKTHKGYYWKYISKNDELESNTTP